MRHAVLVLFGTMMLTQCSMELINGYCDVISGPIRTGPDYQQTAYQLVCFDVENTSSIMMDNNLVYKCGNALCSDIRFISSKISTFTKLPANMNFQNFRRFFLNDCDIKVIKNGAFEQFSQIVEMYLENNKLSQITKEVFKFLIKLQLLNLEFNVIHYINEGSFDGNHDLQFLYLGHNRITQISNYLFNKLGNLQELDLSYNFIKSLRFDITIIPSLETLRLENNVLESINVCGNITTDMVQSNFNFLNTSNNYLTDLQDLHCLTLISILDATNNLIENVPDLMQLKELYIGNNSIKQLKILTSVTPLEILDIHSNEIQALPVNSFKPLKQLKILNISNNYLESLEFGLFNGLQLLTTLDLSNNNLTSLEEDSFFSLRSLNELNLNDNRLNTMSVEKILKNCRNLRQLSFAGNDLSCSRVLSILHLLDVSNIIVPYGNDEDTPNIHGIACIRVQPNTTNVTKTTYNQDPKIIENVENLLIIFRNFTTVFNNQIENYKRLFEGKRKLDESEEIKKFLRDDFQNTSFYKYFKDFNNQLNSSIMISKSDLSQLLQELMSKWNRMKNAEDGWKKLTQSFVNDALHQLLSNITNQKNLHSIDYNDTKLINTFNLLITKLQNYTKSEIEMKSFPLLSTDTNAISNVADEITNETMRTNTIILVFGCIFLIISIMRNLRKNLFNYCKNRVNGGFISSELQL